MYNPIQKGIEKSIKSVQYAEARPPSDISEAVHRFWEIKSDGKLTDDFDFHVLPDACVHIVFNLADSQTAGITALRTTAEVLNLGKEFHFVGIRFLPGVWKGSLDEMVAGVVETPYSGTFPLLETGNVLAKLNFADQIPVLSELVHQLIDANLVTIDTLTAKLLANLDAINNVADMAVIADMSPRQLQRVLKQATGFSPHDLLKVLRIQQSFVKHYLNFFADQSHFIHSFRKITGYTPETYAIKFDV